MITQSTDWFYVQYNRGCTLHRYVADKFSYSIKIPPPRELETEGIIGVTSIVDCLEEFSNSPWHVLGSFGFLLKDSRQLPFMPYKGKLSFFEVDYTPATK
jgi:hypothetical protein